jgi:hypothetical protein
MPMSTQYLPVELGSGWECRVEIKRNANGSIDAKAEILCRGVPRCVLVSLNQSSHEIAELGLTDRARDYVKRQLAGRPPAA